MKIPVKFSIFLITLLGVIYACQKNVLHPQDEKTVTPLSIEEAKNSYEVRQFASLSGSLNCGNLPNLPITPEWSKSKQHNFEKFSVVETPLLWNNQQLGRLKRLNSTPITRNKNTNEVETVTSLLSVKDSIGNITKKIMVISAGENYLKNNNIKNNDYKHKDPKFTGEVAYYNEDGSFFVGWLFEGGQIIKQKNKISCNQFGELKTRDYAVCQDITECTDWYVNGIYDGSTCYFYTECTIVSTCCTYDPYGYSGSGGSTNTVDTGYSDSDLDTWGPDTAPPGCKATENRNMTVDAFISKCRLGSIRQAKGFADELLTRTVGSILDRANSVKEKTMRKLINDSRFVKPD